MHKQELQQVYNFILKGIQNNGSAPTLAEVEQKFLPDASEFQGMVLLEMSHSTYRMGSFRKWVLLDSADYDWWKANPTTLVNFGEVYGKHSDVHLPFGAVVTETITDAHDIQFKIDMCGVEPDSYLADDMGEVRYEMEQRDKEM